MPNLSDPEILRDLRSLDIGLAVGGADYFFESNHRLSEALWEKGIWHAFEVWPGTAHKPHYWREMAGRHR